MKTPFPVLLAVFAVCSTGIAARPQAVTTPDAVTGVSSSAHPSPALPYGVHDILKLSGAKVSEQIITSYIRNAGTTYNLKPETIIYLKEHGVSDKVIDTMLNNRPAGEQHSVQTSGTTSVWTNQPLPQDSTARQQQAAPVYIQPPQPDPERPRSSVHIIQHYPAFPNTHWSIYPGGVYSYWGRPRLSFSLALGFGGFRHHRFGCW